MTPLRDGFAAVHSHRAAPDLYRKLRTRMLCTGTGCDAPVSGAFGWKYLGTAVVAAVGVDSEFAGA
jgi:hypothetical protein